MEDITDADYVHAKRIFKDFEIQEMYCCQLMYLRTFEIYA